MKARVAVIPTTAELLERVRLLIQKQKNDGQPVSDYALGKQLGFSHQRISNYMTGKTTLDDEACTRVAEALNLPLETVLACVYLERAKRQENDEVTSAWERICRRVAMAFTPVFIGYFAALLSVSDVLSF